jgi:hypothetical protein
VTHPNLVIVRVVGGRNLDGSSPELHVNNDVVCDDGDPPLDEGMLCKFAMQMLWTGKSRNNKKDRLTLYRRSSGCTAIAVSPSIVSGRVVATMIFSSKCSVSILLSKKRQAIT